MKRWSDLLDSLEGLRLYVYDDYDGSPIKPGSIVVGHPTIGYGRALDTAGITKPEAEGMRNNSLNAAFRFAQSFPWFTMLDEVRQCVVTLMIYQLGSRGFSAFRKTIAAIDDLDFPRAATEMLDSEWAVQTPKRARLMSEMMKTGRYPDEQRPA